MKTTLLTLVSILLFLSAYSQINWQQLNGPYGTAVSQMINHNGEIFISTNQNQEIGRILKTSNNGISWTDVTGNLNHPYTRNFAQIGNSLYVGQDTSVYVTTNNGTTWTDISNNLPYYEPIVRIAAHQNRLFAVTYDGTGYEELFYSDNNGGTWTSTGFIAGITSSFRDFYSDGNNFWAAVGSSVYLSTDSGITWVNKSLNIPFSAFIQSIVAKGDTLYCGTSLGVYNSVDGANLWMPAIGGITQQTVGNAFVIDGNTVYLATGESGVYSTLLGNSNWTAVGSLPYYTYITCMAKNGSHLLIGLLDGFYDYTLPNGTWILRVDGLLLASIRAVYAEGAMILASINNNRGVQISTDSGATWQSTNLNTGQYKSSIKKIGSTYFAISALSGVHTSTNGINWSYVPIGNAGVNCLTTTGNKILAGASNGLYQSTDGGATWSLTGSGLPVNANVYDVVVSGIDVYACNGSKKIYVSHDGGNKFALGNNGGNLISTFSKLEVLENYVIAYTTPSISRSHDGGQTFTIPGLNSYIYNNQSYTSGRNIFITSGGSIQISDDIGKSWHNWVEGLNPNMGGLSCFGTNGQLMYGGTDNTGIWKRNYYPELFTTNAVGSTFCAGSQVTFNFSSTATFNAGNKFYLQLSDSTGSFANPLIIDSLTSTTPSSFNATLPLNSKQGVYRVRTVSTDPYVVANDNGYDFYITALPKITLQPANQHTCDSSGTGFFIGVTGTNLTYQWQVNMGGSVYTNLSNNATYTGVNSNLLLINPATAIMNLYKYRCLINGACSPQDTSNFGILNVSSPAPTINVQPADATVCDLAAATFMVNVTGPSLTYQWQVDNGSGFFTNVNNNTIYNGATTDILSINSTAAMDGYKYRCEISSCEISDAATLTVNGTPVSPNISFTQMICDGSPASFGISVPGAGITYQWQENTGSGFVNLNNGGNYSGVLTNQLDIAVVTASMNGYQYQCIINGVCLPFQSTSNPMQIGINTGFATILQQPINKSFCVKTEAWFAVSATSTGFLNYQWEMNDGSGWMPLQNTAPFSGADQDTLRIDTIGFGLNTAQFRCLVSSCTYSNAATLTVLALPSVSVNQFPGLFCSGDPAVALSGGFPSGGTYYGTGISGGLFYPASAGVGSFPLTYVYTNASGCTASASQNLQVDFCIGVGINEPAPTKNEWIVYPNPSADFITVTNTSSLSKKTQLQLFNSIGKLVFQKQIDASVIEKLAISRFENGLYLVKFTDEKCSSTLRLVISK